MAMEVITGQLPLNSVKSLFIIIKELGPHKLKINISQQIKVTDK